MCLPARCAFVCLCLLSYVDAGFWLILALLLNEISYSDAETLAAFCFVSAAFRIAAAVIYSMWMCGGSQATKDRLFWTQIALGGAVLVDLITVFAYEVTISNVIFLSGDSDRGGVGMGLVNIALQSIWLTYIAWVMRKYAAAFRAPGQPSKGGF